MNPMIPTSTVCPTCDVVYAIDAETEMGARCKRCGTTLVVGQVEAVVWVVGLSFTSAILMGLVLFLPFLSLDAGPFGARASVLETVMALNEGIMLPLSLAVMAFILLLPLGRFLLLIWSLGPLIFHRAPWPGAVWALRIAFVTRPWAMAEIFMVGVAVALIKLADMATLALGPAFWAFLIVVILNAYQDTLMCRHTLWTALTQAHLRSQQRAAAA